MPNIVVHQPNPLFLDYNFLLPLPLVPAIANNYLGFFAPLDAPLMSSYFLPHQHCTISNNNWNSKFENNLLTNIQKKMNYHDVDCIPYLQGICIHRGSTLPILPEPSEGTFATIFNCQAFFRQMDQ